MVKSSTSFPELAVRVTIKKKTAQRFSYGLIWKNKQSYLTIPVWQPLPSSNLVMQCLCVKKGPKATDKYAQ